jgi:hypothetical protein
MSGFRFRRGGGDEREAHVRWANGAIYSAALAMLLLLGGIIQSNYKLVSEARQQALNGLVPIEKFIEINDELRTKTVADFKVALALSPELRSAGFNCKTSTSSIQLCDDLIALLKDAGYEAKIEKLLHARPRQPHAAFPITVYAARPSINGALFFANALSRIVSAPHVPVLSVDDSEADENGNRVVIEIFASPLYFPDGSVSLGEFTVMQ